MQEGIQSSSVGLPLKARSVVQFLAPSLYIIMAWWTPKKSPWPEQASGNYKVFTILTLPPIQRIATKIDQERWEGIFRIQVHVGWLLSDSTDFCTCPSKIHEHPDQSIDLLHKWGGREEGGTQIQQALETVSITMPCCSRTLSLLTQSV